MNIDLKKLKIAIKNEHHACERFYDIEIARQQREVNLEMADRIENGMASREDEEAAIELIKRYEK